MLPDLLKYFSTGQMVVARHWLLQDDGDSATVLEPALLGSYKSLYYLVYRGVQLASLLTGSMGSTLRSWDRLRVLMEPDGLVPLPSTLL